MLFKTTALRWFVYLHYLYLFVVLRQFRSGISDIWNYSKNILYRSHAHRIRVFAAQILCWNKIIITVVAHGGETTSRHVQCMFTNRVDIDKELKIRGKKKENMMNVLFIVIASESRKIIL